MTKKPITIKIPSGLEARPVALLVQVASQYESDIYVEFGDKKVNAKSIMGVMTLAANKGSRLQIETTGDDEVEALAALVALVEDYFGEGE